MISPTLFWIIVTCTLGYLSYLQVKAIAYKRKLDEQRAKRRLDVEVRRTARGRHRIHFVDGSGKTVAFSPEGYTEQAVGVSQARRYSNCRLRYGGAK